MDINDIAHSLGALHEKTDNQTVLLNEIRDDIKDHGQRIAKLEGDSALVSTIFRYGKYIVGLVIGFVTGHHF